ncbi:MAG: FAD-dependent monooxygenase [Litorimonas sp.]
MIAKTASKTDVLIVGAGIGGLTLAHALLQRGKTVQVLERAAALENVGAGIQIPPNAMKVLRALKLDSAVMATAFRPLAIEARMGQSGRSVFDIPLAETSLQRWGAPYLHIHRANYIAALSKTLPEGVLKLNSGVVGYQKSANTVSVKLADGSVLSSSYLVGADGIRSSVREQLIGPDSAQFTGNVAWRTVVPTALLGDLAPNPTACAWFGPGRHAVTYRLGVDGNVVNFVGVVEQDNWQEEGWSIPGIKENLQNDFKGWHPVIRNIIENADDLYRWALFDRPPLERWVDDSVALMGDAAHPMLPFLAQGAAMAVEDAWVLAEVISNGDDLSEYQNRRHIRTTKVQAASRANMGLFHKVSRTAQLMTYGPMWMAGKMAPNIVHRRMDWLYGFDVTQT